MFRLIVHNHKVNIIPRYTLIAATLSCKVCYSELWSHPHHQHQRQQIILYARLCMSSYQMDYQCHIRGHFAEVMS